MLKIPKDIIASISRYNDFYIVGHKDPDGDCIGSQIAMDLFLKRQGKNSVLLSPGPFKTTEVNEYEAQFRTDSDRVLEELKGDECLLVLDCSTIDRIVDFGALTKKLHTIVIDHHASGQEFGNQRFIVPTAPSTTYLIQHIIEDFIGSVSKQEGEFIFFGLATDTGFFRFLNDTSAPVFHAAARLVEAGVNPRKVQESIQSGQSFASRKWLARMLDRSESHFDGKLKFCWETLQDREEFTDIDRESDTLYHLLLGIETCKVMIFIREEPAGGCKVSMRSKDRIDVGNLAASMGGGGHVNAAGLTSKRSLEELKELLIHGVSLLL